MSGHTVHVDGLNHVYHFPDQPPRTWDTVTHFISLTEKRNFEGR